MKKSDYIFAVLRLFFDLVSITLAFILAYWLRVFLEIPQETVYAWPFSQYLKFVLVFLPFLILIFTLEGLYNIKEEKKNLKEFSSIFLGVSAGFTLVLVWIFLGRFLFFSRLVIVYAFVLTLVSVTLGRFFLRLLRGLLYKKGIGLHRVLIVGQSDLAKKIASTIKNNPSFGLSLFKKGDKEAVLNLEKIWQKNKFDEIILAEPTLSSKEVEKALRFCEDSRIVFKMVPGIFQAQTARMEIGSLFSYPLLSFKKTPLEGWGRIIKRIFDFMLGLIFLIVTSPLFIVIPLLIKIDSKGPIFFKHKRVGGEGKGFELYKFRSMIKEAPFLYQKLAEKQKTRIFFPKIEQDPRITKIGRFLRTTFLDELPQLFNVLRGEMSLVGPRPLTPLEFKQVSDYERRYKGVSYIKPGLTGLWQISGRGGLTDEERLSLDIYYLENWSLFLDFLIILKTPFVILKSRKETE